MTFFRICKPKIVHVICQKFWWPFISHWPFFRISALNIKDFTRKFVILSLKKSVIDLFSGFQPLTLIILHRLLLFPIVLHFIPLIYTPTPTSYFPVPFLHLTFYSRNSQYYIGLHLLFFLTSSLHKQPFITARFRSSLHHCTLKQALL